MCLHNPSKIETPSITAYKFFEKRNNKYYSIFQSSVNTVSEMNQLYKANGECWTNEEYPPSFHAILNTKQLENWLKPYWCTSCDLAMCTLVEVRLSGEIFVGYDTGFTDRFYCVAGTNMKLMRELKVEDYV